MTVLWDVKTVCSRKWNDSEPARIGITPIPYSHHIPELNLLGQSINQSINLIRRTTMFLHFSTTTFDFKSCGISAKLANVKLSLYFN
jgi:hypothetical protein